MPATPETPAVELTVCIPAYNEAGAIRATLEALRGRFGQAQIIVVDDASTDETGAIARGVGGIEVITHTRNMGYGAAIKTAMRRARGEVVAWYDADGQHRPEDLAAVVAPVLAGEKDAVIGARVKGSDVRRGRVPGKMVLKHVAQAVAREKIRDLNSGLRCFRRDVILRYAHLLPDRFSASTTSTLVMIKRGYRLGYVDIVTSARVGTSTVRMSDGLAALHLITRLLVLFEAFRFFGVLSLLQIVPGLTYGLYVAFTHHQGFPTLASTVVTSGVLTFLIGLVCDQIAAMRQERFEGE
ncbi:MAG: glycosyltransferase family 2 protein [Planctomycetota bacterium]|nr:glycosyltransferase family 2 protein [Planctomycetota bacterium]